MSFQENLNGQNFKVTVFILFLAKPLPCLHHIKMMKSHFTDLKWSSTSPSDQEAQHRLFKKTLRGPALEAYNRAYTITETRAHATYALALAAYEAHEADPDNDDDLSTQPPTPTLTFTNILAEFKKQCLIDQRSALRQLKYIKNNGKPGWLAWSNYLTFFNFQEAYRSEMLGTDNERALLSTDDRIEILRAAAPSTWIDRLDDKYPDQSSKRTPFHRSHTKYRLQQSRGQAKFQTNCRKVPLGH